MEIERTALAGTLESSDIQITVSHGNHGIEIDLQSDVIAAYGDQIRSVITGVLVAHGIESAHVKAVDKGALDCTIKARTITAVQRALGTENDPNWKAIAR